MIHQQLAASFKKGRKIGIAGFIGLGKSACADARRVLGRKAGEIELGVVERLSAQRDQAARIAAGKSGTVCSDERHPA